jgi:hypothetical protein
MPRLKRNEIATIYGYQTGKKLLRFRQTGKHSLLVLTEYRIRRFENCLFW